MPVQVSAFSPAKVDDPQKAVITDGDRFERLVRFLETRKEFVFDYETSGLAWFQNAEAVGIAFGAWDDNGVLWNSYVPFRHQTGQPQLSLDRIGPAIKRLLATPDILKIAHNIKFEDHFSRKEGWSVRGPRFCTMVAGRLYNENEYFSLEHRAACDLGIPDAKKWKKLLDSEIVSLAKQNKMRKTDYLNKYGYGQVDIYLCGKYACTDTEHAGLLKQLYDGWGVREHYPRIWKTETDLTEVLCDVEQAGMPVDRGYLEWLQAQVQAAKHGLEEKISTALKGEMFKLGSDMELRYFLQDVLGLTLFKETKASRPWKKVYSVDAEVLDHFSDQSEILKLILHWRDADKIDTTYATGMLKLLDSKNYVHGNLKQHGTNTGRLSCEKPNYQNMYKDSEDRAERFNLKKDPWSIRRAFPVREKGYVRLFHDYSQIELRVLAAYSKDPIMVDAYLKGEDIHQRTSDEVHGCPRRHAKVINFGLSYGMGANGLSRQANIPFAEAEDFMEKFFKRYVGIKRFRYKLWGQARNQQCQWNNLFGRTRRLPDLNSPDRKLCARAERQMIGSAIQGTAAELTKESLVRIWKWIKSENVPAQIVNTVHDEIQIDCPLEWRDHVAVKAKQLMEDFPEFAPIPIIVDAEYTDTTWDDKKELEL